MIKYSLKILKEIELVYIVKFYFLANFSSLASSLAAEGLLIYFLPVDENKLITLVRLYFFSAFCNADFASQNHAKANSCKGCFR
ncbi:hypothetical protein CAP36_06185 [Chitinophagaceae bacterium IBVUCB2]|nr:hypothetical protein CAP36_06185 [Chitinophagaceae bacterium IBVUCB2]